MGKSHSTLVSSPPSFFHFPTLDVRLAPTSTFHIYARLLHRRRRAIVTISRLLTQPPFRNVIASMNSFVQQNLSHSLTRNNSIYRLVNPLDPKLTNLRDCNTVNLPPFYHFLRAFLIFSHSTRQSRPFAYFFFCLASNICCYLIPLPRVPPFKIK